MSLNWKHAKTLGLKNIPGALRRGYTSHKKRFTQNNNREVE
jgi:hypothetical protein